jgi:hypothetical protein
MVAARRTTGAIAVEAASGTQDFVANEEQAQERDPLR